MRRELELLAKAYNDGLIAASEFALCASTVLVQAYNDSIQVGANVADIVWLGERLKKD